MKTLKTILTGIAVVAVSFTTINASTALSGAPQSQAILQRGVSCSQICSYLVATGHTILTTPVQDGNIWTCNTRKSDGHTYFTTVYTEGDEIVGHTDIQID